LHCNAMEGDSPTGGRLAAVAKRGHEICGNEVVLLDLSTKRRLAILPHRLVEGFLWLDDKSVDSIVRKCSFLERNHERQIGTTTQ